VDTLIRLLDAAGSDNAVVAFMNLDKGLPEIEEMRLLTPTQRIEHLMVEVRAADVLCRTHNRIRRVSGEHAQPAR
jgi:hypothetical protein